jgi:hypothetical protein
MDWKALLAYITGSVDQALLLRNEYLYKPRVSLSDSTCYPLISTLSIFPERKSPVA